MTVLDCAAGFRYPNGQAAFSFLPDGSGFAYYPSGRPAFCVSTVNSYQNRFFLYNDDASAAAPEERRHAVPAAGKAAGSRVDGGARRPRKSGDTLLCALDENVVGFAVDCSEGKQHGRRIVLTKEGGLVSEADGRISMQWKWDRTLQNAGTPPSEAISLTLNKFFTFTFSDRFTVFANFVCEGAKCRLDLGMKMRRTDTYLDHAERVTSGPHFGKLMPRVKHQSLKERQEAFNRDMQMKRSLLNPKSENLSQEVRSSRTRCWAACEG